MSGIAAFGTMLKIGGTAGTAVANVTNFDGPGLSAEMIDMTAHDSGGDYREWVPSFLDGGELTIRYNYDPAEPTHKAAAGGLLHLWKNKQSSLYALVFPDAASTTWTFTAYVRSMSPSAPFEGKLEGSVTLKITGEPTLV